MIDADLELAYRQTDYWVATEPVSRWRIGHTHPRWVGRQAERGVSCATWLTAYNPASAQQTAKANERAHQRLCQALAQARWDWLPAWAQHPSNGWPIEHGAMVWGMDWAAAGRWGARFGQRAVVWMDAEGTAHLRWMA